MIISEEDKEFLNQYSAAEFEKPSATVDAVILRLINKQNNNYRKLPEKKLQVFLNKRNVPPFKNQFAIVGTFLNLNHELNETMQLCVKDKVNLTNYYFEQLFTFGDKLRDPRTRVLSTSYLLLTNEDEVLTNGEWFDISLSEISNQTVKNENGYSVKNQVEITLSNENYTFTSVLNVSLEKNGLTETKKVEIVKNAISFDHIKIIFYALERLKNKLEYTDIIFNLLPKHFTLTELKNCYEVILNKKLLDANFRRKTAKLVSPTDNYVTGKGHRSSQLFTHNPLWTINNLD